MSSKEERRPVEATKIMCTWWEGCTNEVEEENGNFTLELCAECNERHLKEEGYKTCRKCTHIIPLEEGGAEETICLACLKKNG